MKKILSAILLASICIMLVTPVGAKEIPIVEFDGTTQLKYNMEENAFGTNFEGMVPGEERVQSIILKNNGDRLVDFFMSTEVIQAFEEENAKNGGYIVSLTLNQDGQETLIYGNRSEINVGADENGLYDMNGTLNDKFMIASIEPEKEATVSLAVKLDGQSMGNDYQGLPGTFQFDFTVQYDDSEPEVVVNTIVNTIIENIKTGDPVTIGGLLFALGASAGAIVLMKKGGRKDEK